MKNNNNNNTTNGHYRDITYIISFLVSNLYALL